MKERILKGVGIGVGVWERGNEGWGELEKGGRGFSELGVGGKRIRHQLEDLS